VIAAILTALLAPSAAAPAPPPACVQSAIDLHRGGEYLAAARTAMRCWERTRHARALLVASQARQRLGHLAHAARILAAFDVQRAAADPWSRDAAAALLAALAAATGALRVEVVPRGDPATSRLELHFLDDPDREPLRVALDGRADVPPVHLDPGPWRLVLRRPGFEPAVAELTARRQATHTLVVRTRRLPAPPRVDLPAHLSRGTDPDHLSPGTSTSPTHLSPGTAPSPARPPAATTDLPPAAAAELLIADGELVAAAGLLEAAWLAASDPAALVQAAECRAGADHSAHAVAYLTHALTLDLPSDLAARARTALAAARPRTVAVPVELDLHADGPAAVRVTPGAAAAPVLQFTLPPGPGAHRLRLGLHRGRWRIDLVRGDRLDTRVVDVADRPPPVVFHEPAPPGPGSRRAAHLRLAGGIVGGALAVPGFGVLLHAHLTLLRAGSLLTSGAGCDPYGPCRPDLAAAADLRSTGAAILGGGLGVLGGALTASLRRPRSRRIAWSVELGLGGALTAAGAALGAVAGANFNTKLAGQADPDWLFTLADRHAAGAALLGLGVGLAGTATLGLALDLTEPRRPLRAQLGPTGLTARF
jgi:hypothetical protein